MGTGFGDVQVIYNTGVKIRNSEPGATFKEFVEKWPLGIAFSIKK